jgi:carbon-monoxide dehydrogenase small subunit
MTSIFEEIDPEPAGDIPVRRVTLTLNGVRRAAEIEPRLLLAHLLRNGFRLTGTHTGCDTTNCGACTVLFDGRPVKSCTMLAVQADGHDVMTVEGLRPRASSTRSKRLQGARPNALLHARDDADGEGLLDERERARTRCGGAVGNCRCTGYQNIVKAVLWAAAKRRGE